MTQDELRTQAQDYAAMLEGRLQVLEKQYRLNETMPVTRGDFLILANCLLLTRAEMGQVLSDLTAVLGQVVAEAEQTARDLAEGV